MVKMKMTVFRSNSVLFIGSFISIAFGGICQVSYPYPVERLSLTIEEQTVKMAYMDIKPFSRANRKTVVLLHGKNFNGYYWKNVIPALINSGYRVVVPDQVGWGRSDKPDIHYSFHLLARN